MYTCACTILVHYTGDTKKISHWAEVVAPFISEQRSIVYVDFVEDAALLAMKMTENHGIRTGTNILYTRIEVVIFVHDGIDILRT